MRINPACIYLLSWAAFAAGAELLAAALAAA